MDNLEENIGKSHSVKFSNNGNVIISSKSFGNPKLVLKPKEVGNLLTWLYCNITDNTDMLKIMDKYY